MGADVMIEITGHFGVINQRVIKAYTGDGDDFTWGSATSIDAAAAGSEIELEAYLPGSDSSYYIHLTGWDDAVDSAGTYQQEDKSGSRGTPSIPVYDSTDWIQVGADVRDATDNSADIFNDDSGSRYDSLMVYDDGSEFTYFMIFLEADPYQGGGNYEYTYAALMEEDASDGDYDYAVAIQRDTTNNHYDVKVYQWTTVFGTTKWWNTDRYDDCTETGYCRIVATNNQEHIAFVAKHSDTFALAGDNDFLKAVTHDTDDEAFGNAWENTRDPTPAASLGDYTSAAAIPEFPTLLMPVLSVILIVGMNYRKRRNELASRV
jgi:hypothetical protein